MFKEPVEVSRARGVLKSFPELETERKRVRDVCFCSSISKEEKVALVRAINERLKSNGIPECIHLDERLELWI